jgi:hypothetical protein
MRASAGQSAIVGRCPAHLQHGEHQECPTGGDLSAKALSFFACDIIGPAPAKIRALFEDARALLIA